MEGGRSKQGLGKVRKWKLGTSYDLYLRAHLVTDAFGSMCLTTTGEPFRCCASLLVAWDFVDLHILQHQLVEISQASDSKCLDGIITWEEEGEDS